MEVCSWSVLGACLHGDRTHALRKLIFDCMTLPVLCAKILYFLSNVLVVIGDVPQIFVKRRSTHDTLTENIDSGLQRL